MNIHNHTGCRYPASTHVARAVGGGPKNWVASAFVLCVCREVGWGGVKKKKTPRGWVDRPDRPAKAEFSFR